MRAFLDARTAPARHAALIPVLRARVTGVQRQRRQPRELRGRARRAARSAASTRSPIAITSRRTSRSSTGRSGRAAGRCPPTRRARGLDRAEHPRALPDQRRRQHALRRARPDDRGARHQRPRRSTGRTRATGGFMFVFRPARSIRRRTRYIGIAPGAGGSRRRGRCFQRDLVAQFPNVSAIDVREVLATVQTRGRQRDARRSRSSAASRCSAASLILIGAVAMTKFQRVYEAAILRTLGASTRLLGDDARARVQRPRACSPASIGALGALALSWAVCRFVFDIAWQPAPLAARRRRAADDGAGRRRSAWSRAPTCSGRSRSPR